MDDEVRDRDLDRAPGLGRVRVLSPGPVGFMNEGEGGYKFGEALGVFQEVDDQVGGWVDQHCKGKVDHSERMGVGEEGCTLLDWPG